MRIALLMYANDYPNRGGIWRYSYNLARHLIDLDKGNQYSFVHGKKRPENFVGLERNERILPMSFFRKIRILPKILAKEGFDVIHETANIAPLFSKERYKKIVTILDLTALIYPETTNLKGYLFFKFYLTQALKKVDVIITPSESTKRDIQNFYNVPPEKVKVIHPGIEEKFFQKVIDDEIKRFKKRKKIDFPFLLWVGAINPHKNLEMLFRVFKILPEGIQKEYKIVLAGYLGDKPYRTLRQVKDLKLEDKVVFGGAVEEDDLILLYKSAELLVFPSLYEGFGFPVLEAMASGTPVLCSNAASLPEIVGEGGILIEPNDIKAWRDNILKVISDSALKKELSERGVKQAKKFTWQKCASAHWEIYNAV